MAKNQPTQKASKHTSQPAQMIPDFTMLSSVPQVPPHLMHQDILPTSQQISDLTTLSTVMSQEDLAGGNIPMIEQLIELPHTETRQIEPTPQSQRETSTSQAEGQSGMSDEELDQTIFDIISGESVDSPMSYTSDTIPGTQVSPRTQSHGSAQSPNLPFLPEGQGQIPSSQDSPQSSTSMIQDLISGGQAYPVHQYHSSVHESHMSGGQGSHHMSGLVPYPGPRMEDPDVYGHTLYQGHSYGQGPRGSPLLPHGMDYRPEAGATSQEGQPRLWKFVLDLLEDPRYNPSLITWVSRHEGIFRLMDPPRLAEFWGHVKGNKSMNYEKLSRGLRYYYNHQVLEHVPGKLVYKFGPTAQVWQYIAQTSHARPATTATSTVTSQYPPHTSQ